MKILTGNDNRYELRTVYDSTEHYVRNMRERNESGKGFLPGREGRKIASIPLEDFMRLVQLGNQDAVAAMAGDDTAMRRLIRAHPEWRTSEGGI
jgi:hypothetical protein